MKEETVKTYDPRLFLIWVASLFGTAVVAMGLLLASQYAGFPLLIALVFGLVLFGGVTVAYVPLFYGKIADLPYIPFHLAPPTKFSGASSEVPCLGWITDLGDGKHFTVDDKGTLPNAISLIGRNDGVLFTEDKRVAIVSDEFVRDVVQAWFDDDPYPADKPVRVSFWGD